MFGKKEHSAIKTLVAQGTRIDGDMKFEDGVRVEAGEEDGRRPGQQRPVEPDAEAVDVEQRQRQHEPVARRPPPGETDGF